MFASILLILGLLLLLSQTLHLNIGYFLGYLFPIALIAFGFYRLVLGKKRSLLTWNLLAIGLVMVFHRMHVLHGSLFWLIVAALLIVYGLFSLLKSRIGKNTSQSIGSAWFSSANAPGETTQERAQTQDAHTEVFAEKNRTIDRDVLDETIIFSQATYRVLSSSFSGGHVTSIFSDAAFDLENVRPLDREISMDIVCIFSEITLHVPSDWHVIVAGRQYPAVSEAEGVLPAATLFVRSTSIFGSIKVI